MPDKSHAERVYTSKELAIREVANLHGLFEEALESAERLRFLADLADHDSLSDVGGFASEQLQDLSRELVSEITKLGVPPT